MKRKLQIANCKLKIENWGEGSHGPLGRGSLSAAISNRASMVSPRWLVFPIFNFQFLLLFLVGSLAFAADLPPSTDNQLRDSLNSKVGDDYDRELLGDPAKPDGKGSAVENMQKKLQKELGSAAQREGKPKNPLLQVAETMSEVPPRLNLRDSGAVTQHLQRQIVSDLEKLIEQAKKFGPNSGKKSNGRKPTGNGNKKPAQNPGKAPENPPAAAQESNSQIRRKPEDIRAEEAAKAREQMIETFRAELQQHNRQKMLELPSEYFLPEYELEIEDYFRRLSEDQPDSGKTR